MSAIEISVVVHLVMSVVCFCYNHGRFEKE